MKEDAGVLRKVVGSGMKEVLGGSTRRIEW